MALSIWKVIKVLQLLEGIVHFAAISELKLL